MAERIMTMEEREEIHEQLEGIDQALFELGRDGSPLGEWLKGGDGSLKAKFEAAQEAISELEYLLSERA